MKEHKLHNKSKCVSIVKVFAISFIVVISLAIGVPLIINELYKIDKGYITLWDAADVLAYYAEILGGMISIIALYVTIFYTKQDTERQIKASQAQYNVPFFLISSVSQSNNSIEFPQKRNYLAWHKDLYISDITENQNCISINLKNIGDGLAITPRYKISILSESQHHTNRYIDKENYFELKYDLYHVLLTKFSPNLLPRNNETFSVNITIYYQNIAGILFSQEIVIDHICTVNNSTVSLSINEIGPQQTVFEQDDTTCPLLNSSSK